MTDFPHAQSLAARMLANGLRTAAAERQLSLRQIGKQLGYSQPVVLSHMATGRVPIPIDRALDIADGVGIPPKAFLEAVLEQRHPDIDWQMVKGPADAFCDELQSIATKPLSALSMGHHKVLRDVVAEPDPTSRWVSTAEAPVMNLLRELFPQMSANGLTEGEKETIRVIAKILNEQDLEA